MQVKNKMEIPKLSPMIKIEAMLPFASKTPCKNVLDKIWRFHKQQQNFSQFADTSHLLNKRAKKYIAKLELLE